MDWCSNDVMLPLPFFSIWSLAVGLRRWTWAVISGSDPLWMDWGGLLVSTTTNFAHQSTSCTDKMSTELFQMSVWGIYLSRYLYMDMNWRLLNYALLIIICFQVISQKQKTICFMLQKCLCYVFLHLFIHYFKQCLKNEYVACHVTLPLRLSFCWSFVSSNSYWGH